MMNLKSLVWVVPSALVSMGAAQAETTPVPDISDKIYSEWNEPNRPNDGVVKLEAKAGGDARGCQVIVSKAGCTAVRCKGEAPLIGNSAVSLEGAARRAENQAYKRLAEFLEVGVRSKEFQKELLEESTVDGLERSNFASSITGRFSREANQILSGATTLSDGVADVGGRKTAYSIVGQSCLTQNAAGDLKRGNAANAGPNPKPKGGPAGQGGAGGTGGAGGALPPVEAFDRQNTGDF